jgi:hypothetical protein
MKQKDGGSNQGKGSPSYTPAQKLALKKASKNRTDKYGNSGFGETKSGVTAKDMAKINKGRDRFDQKMPIDQMITPRGNVRGYMGVYDDPAKARAAAKAVAQKANRMDGFGAGKPRPKESDRMVERSSNVSEYMYDESTRKKMKRQGK